MSKKIPGFADIVIYKNEDGQIVLKQDGFKEEPDTIVISAQQVDLLVSLIKEELADG